MADVWWAIIRKPNGAVHLYELGPEPYDTEFTRAKTAQSVPAPDVNGELPAGWEISLSSGEPHPELIWSKAEVAAARDQVESAAGIPGQRARIQAMLDNLDAAAAAKALPVDLLNRQYDELRRVQRAIKHAAIEDVAAALAAGTPPSRAVVHRRPAKA